MPGEEANDDERTDQDCWATKWTTRFEIEAGQTHSWEDQYGGHVVAIAPRAD